MSHARYIVGDVRHVLAHFEPGSVDLVLTSPPFLALRSYLPAGHPDKPLEIGSEPTPGEFIDTLLDVVEACRRVLAPHGSICIELGDTYSGSGGAGGDYGDQGMRDGQPKFDGSGRRNRPADVAAGILAPTKRPGPQGRDEMAGWPLDKSACLIPESFRWALAYGRNPFTGRETPRWRIRNTVRWCRPNPPVGALGDKFRPATSDMVIATMARDRYFDLDAVREPASENTHARSASGVAAKPRTGKSGDDDARGGNWSTLPFEHSDTSAPPLDWWKISTQPYEGSHYATWPEQLCVRPIKAMVPLRVCTTCGQPSRRVVEVLNASGKALVRNRSMAGRKDGPTKSTEHPDATDRRTVGWTDCGHDSWRTGVVLDPFAGSGTTLAVATGHGRDAIGIDLDERNARLALERVGPLLLTIEDTGEAVPA